MGASVGAGVSRVSGLRCGALIHTEVRDAAAPCFHVHDLEAYREATGLEIPPQAASPLRRDYQRLPLFPASHVIADNHPLYVYYRWYWKQGDGWNDLNTAVHRGLKEYGRPGDCGRSTIRPCGWQASTAAAATWTCSRSGPIPIPIRSASPWPPTSCWRWPAGGPARQQVMKMTQIIWYRSQTAPCRKAGRAAAGLSGRLGTGAARGPVHHHRADALREALWTKIARPIKGIMYHGYQSLVSVRAAGQLLLHQSADAERAGPAHGPGDPAAGADAAVGAGRQERRGFPGELCRGDVRPPRHLWLGRQVAGRRLSRVALCPSAAGDRL